MSDPVQNARDLCIELLPGVSRTFALTIPVLPEALRAPVGCSYLLCRIADNIEDHPDMEDGQRDQLFDRFLEGVTGKEPGTFVESHPSGPGHDLALRLPEILLAFRSFPEAHRNPIETCVREMVCGMRKIILHRSPDRAHQVCKTIEELEEYCHYVAGTVGIMLYRIFTDFMGTSPDPEKEEAARRFGLGLQLTNILQDRNVDSSRGISFLPPGNMDPIFLRALSRLKEGHTYSLSLPPEQEGLRLFCLWALWMAVATLEEVLQSDHQRPKIDRNRVTEILAFTRTHVQSNETLNRRFQADLERTKNRLTESELIR